MHGRERSRGEAGVLSADCAFVGDSDEVEQHSGGKANSIPV